MKFSHNSEVMIHCSIEKKYRINDSQIPTRVAEHQAGRTDKKQRENSESQRNQ